MGIADAREQKNASSQKNRSASIRKRYRTEPNIKAATREDTEALEKNVTPEQWRPKKNTTTDKPDPGTECDKGSGTELDADDLGEPGTVSEALGIR